MPPQKGLVAQARAMALTAALIMTSWRSTHAWRVVPWCVHPRWLQARQDGGVSTPSASASQVLISARSRLEVV